MRRVVVFVLVAVVAAAAAYFVLRPTSSEPPTAHTGAFLLPDQRVIVFAGRDDGCLRAVLSDGQVGKVCPDADRRAAYSGGTYFSGAGPAQIHVEFSEQSLNVSWENVVTGTAARVAETRVSVPFKTREGLELIGELVLPPGDGPVPLLVHIGGSEKSGSVGRVWMPYMLAARGVGSFVYDKRGVGGSAGGYTQDFEVLAEDARCALEAAIGSAGGRRGPVGVVGFSQGGWIAPMMASDAPGEVDAVIVAFGLAVTPLAEEVSEVTARIAAAGHDGETIARAGELATHAVRAAATDFAEGVDAFNRLKGEAEEEGWLDDVGSEGITGALAANPVFFVSSVWWFFDTDTSWDFDPRDTLAALDVRQLWLLGGQDRAAPSEATQRVLADITAGGADVEVKVFPSADHGLVERVGGPSGPAARYVDGYWQAIAEFMVDAVPSSPE